MQEQSSLALFTPDLTEGITFYVELLGFTLDEQRPSADIAQITDTDGFKILLAGPNAGDVTPYLTEAHFTVKPGETLTYANADLDILYTKLHERDERVAITEKRWGDRYLDVYAPGGYILRFYAETQHSEQERLALYLSVVDELETAIAPLSEPELEYTLRPDSWTIRRIVHHLADSETIFIWWLKLALSESGRTYIQNWPDGNDVIATSLLHTKRPIMPSVALVRASRFHIAQLIEYVPEAWEHFTVDSDGNKTTVSELIALMMRHALEHIDEIVAIRREHGL